MKENRERKLNVRVTDAVLAELTKIAEEETRPVATLISILINEALAARKAKSGDGGLHHAMR